jgi:dTDP-4-dehydrorhamnose reductase
MRVLVIGASGMIGSTILKVLSDKNDWEVWGSIRNTSSRLFFSDALSRRIIPGIDVQYAHNLISILEKVRPNIVINCAGLTKHHAEVKNPLISLPINALMPHQLAGFCRLAGARLIHISTDCVFSGKAGFYSEQDCTDAEDLYGKSKALGELSNPGAITLRTSTIGHEPRSKYGLLEWFLSQEKICIGYTRAIFSGMPTVILARVIRDIVIPKKNLHGLYHVAAEPISKFDLLQLIAKVYKKTIEITPSNELNVDRSLDSNRFASATGFVAPNWEDMINEMHAYK